MSPNHQQHHSNVDLNDNMKYKTSFYIKEDTSPNDAFILKIENLNSDFKNLEDNEKKLLAQDPQGFGKDFWGDVISSVKEIESNASHIDSLDEKSKNTILEFKKSLMDYPTIYNIFKPTFDGIDSKLKVSEKTPETKSENKPETKTTTPLDNKTKPEDKKDEYAKDYTGVSIVEFLEKSGKPSDMETRRKLAVDKGIVTKPEEYKGTADQNTRLLNALRGGKVTSDDGTEVKKAELAKPYTTPKNGKGPTIKYGKMEYPAYVDMGGGKNRPAKQEELDNQNIQLYIPNPKKGAAEYNKPNFVKVRREGSDLRPQSQFGGALGSASNFLGDIGRTLAGK